MRGFELFSAFQPEGSEARLFLNNIPDIETAQHLFREIEDLVLLRDFRVRVKYKILKKQSSDEV